MSTDTDRLDAIRESLEAISIALTILAMNQIGAEDAEERQRHDTATQKGLELLVGRLESKR